MTVADDIFDLFHKRGHDAYFGESVSQLEHALQAAWFARQSGATPSLITAALVHDIGHLLHGLPEDIAEHGVNGSHETVASAWLASRFGSSVTEPVRLHVDAKRYLCAVEPEYLKQLSPSSKASLELQGGPFTESEAKAFKRQLQYADAVALRRWDDAAKIPDWVLPGLEQYREAIGIAHALGR